MKCKPNKARAKLAAGQLVTGSAVFSWSPNVMEVAGYAGLDFMRIDNEHAWRQDSSLEHLIRAAVVADVVPIVRIDKDNPYLVRKALEVGAGGIIVPNISTPGEAEAVVRAAKFPPRGERGFSNNCFSGGWGAAGAAEWVEWSDTEPMIGVMVETVEAVECIDEIMAVDGLDFALFGPSDYSMALGLRRPAKNDERVQHALLKTTAAARRAGKHVMYGCGTGAEDVRQAVEAGVTMLELSNDLAILGAVWRKSAGAVQAG
jgi:4-hydroxy-2-oxoheptanedioate aldolase